MHYVIASHASLKQGEKKVQILEDGFPPYEDNRVVESSVF